MIRSAVLALLLVTYPMVSYAGFYDGNKLQGWIESNDRVSAGVGTGLDSMQSGMLRGYVIGIFDSWDGFFCANGKVTIGQMIAVVKKHVAQHPETWGEPAAPLVMRALEAAFPCPRK